MGNRGVTSAFIHGRRAANERLSTDGETLVANGSENLARKVDGIVEVAGGSETCLCVKDEHLDVCQEIARAHLTGEIAVVNYQAADSLSLADLE